MTIGFIRDLNKLIDKIKMKQINIRREIKHQNQTLKGNQNLTHKRSIKIQQLYRREEMKEYRST